MATQNEEIKIKVTMTAAEAAKQLDDLGDKAEHAGDEIKDTTQAFVPLKKQLKEAVLAAQEMSAKFGENSKQAVDAQKKVAHLKEEISDLNDRIDALHPEAKFKAITQVASGIAGGFAAAQGAMALFGSESEDVQRALVKVQAAMAFSQGLNELKGLGDAMKNFKVVALDAFSSIKAAILANPFTALITGLAAVGVAAAAYAASLDGLTTAQKAANAVAEKSLDGYVQERVELEQLVETAKNENLNRKTRQEAIEKLQSTYPDLLENISLENIGTEEMNKKIATQIELLALQARLKAAQELQIESIKEQMKAENSALEENNSLLSYAFKATGNVGAAQVKQNENRKETIKTSGELAKSYQNEIKKTQELIDAILKKSETNVTTTKTEDKANEEAHKAALQRAEERKKSAEALSKKVTDFLAAEQKRIRESDKKFFEDTEKELNQINNNRFKNAKATADQIEQIQITSAENVAFKYEEIAFSFREQMELMTKDITDFLNGSMGATVAFGVNTVSQNLQTVSTFFDAAQQYQLNAAQGNEAQQEAIRKKFFERQKKVQIAQAIMATYQGATNAFTSTAANVALTAAFPAAPYIAAASAVVAGLANVAKIKSTQFQSSSASGGGNGSLPSFNASGSMPEPMKPKTTELDRQGIEAGNSQTIKVYVTETDISNSQKRVNQLRTRAEIK